MTSISARPADSRQDSPPLGQEPTHAVCACQVDATPRLAFCGADCSSEPESWTDTVCVVCFDLICGGKPCARCGGAD